MFDTQYVEEDIGAMNNNNISAIDFLSSSEDDLEINLYTNKMQAKGRQQISVLEMYHYIMDKADTEGSGYETGELSDRSTTCSPEQSTVKEDGQIYAAELLNEIINDIMKSKSKKKNILIRCDADSETEISTDDGIIDTSEDEGEISNTERINKKYEMSYLTEYKESFVKMC